MLRAIRKPSRKALADRQPGGGRRGPKALPGAAEPDPEHPRQQVDERRIGERHADADVRGVEEDLRDAEAEQDQQVEVDDPPPAAQVQQAEQEDRRERQPDVGSVQLVAELVRVSAGHLPGDLVAGPRLAHRPRWRRRRSPAPDPPRRRRSPTCQVPRLRLRLGAQRAVPFSLLADLRVAAGDPDRVGAGQVRGSLGTCGDGSRRSVLRRRRRAGSRGLLRRRGGGEDEQ